GSLASLPGALRVALGRQHPTKHALQISRLRNRRVHRMIRALTVLFQNLQLAIDMSRSGAQDLDQLGAVEMQRTGARNQEAIAIEQPHREFVDAAIRLGAGLDVLAARNESRRIEHDGVEALALFVQCLQDIERRTFERFDAVADAVQFGIAQTEFERLRRAVEQRDFAGAMQRSLNAPAAYIREHIEYAAAFRVGAELRAPGAVIVEPAGLLA